MAPTEPIAYLDNAATTRVRPEAIAAMIPAMEASYANPSGAHALAREARRAVDDARDVLAEALGCGPGDIVFTAGGTEADNLAVFGVHQRHGGVIVCPATEHHAVLHAVEHCGGRVVGVDSMGVVDLDAFSDALDPSVTLVSVMLANNETGVIHDLDQIAAIVRDRAPGALFHTDAVQAFQWVDVAAAAASADMISLSAHKFGGPKGVGVLAVREGVTLAPQLIGGGQERDRRSGTHNTPGIVGMAAAAAATVRTRTRTVLEVGAMRDRLADGLCATIDGAIETAVGGRDDRPAGGDRGNVDRSNKVAGSCHICVDGVESEALLFLLEEERVYASAASSCASGAQDPSHVLAAMGVSRAMARGSLRLSLGYATTEAEIDHALAVVPEAFARLRAFA
ncbi:MAG: cysteine desulfurase [Acidimicrobiia bacterium]|nr:cysteine desulfurase [Acidimicrobiia bacterium]